MVSALVLLSSNEGGEFIYTPTHGGWLNVAEVETNVMVRRLPEPPQQPPGEEAAASPIDQRPSPGEGDLRFYHRSVRTH